MWSSDGPDPFESPKDRLYRLTWQGKYWGRVGAIAQAKRIYGKREKFLSANQRCLSALSSTYYSASANAAAHFRNASLFGQLFWFLRCVLCLEKAIRFSDELEELAGVGGMDHDELDIRSTILRRAHRHNEALVCTREALSRTHVPLGSRVLLEIGLGEIMDQMEKRSDADQAYLRAEVLVRKVDGVIEPTTTVRYYKSYALHYKHWGESQHAKDMLKRALEIAESNGLGDQITKINALID